MSEIQAPAAATPWTTRWASAPTRRGGHGRALPPVVPPKSRAQDTSLCQMLLVSALIGPLANRTASVTSWSPA